jgi:hypothetical protein
MKKYYHIFLPALFPVLLTGCIDNPVQHENYIIKGNVYSSTASFVSIDDFPIVRTGYNGYFELLASNKPFKLSVSGPINNLKFTNVSNTNPQITLHDYEDEASRGVFNYIECEIHIYFPALSGKALLCTKFISNDNFISYSGFKFKHPCIYSTRIIIY